MSIEGDYPERPREGPKLFTEYESVALFGLVAQLGVGIIGTSWLAIVAILIPAFLVVAPMWTTFTFLLMAGPITMVVLIPVSLLQSYYGWRLHVRTANVEKCVRIDAVSLAICLVGIVLTTLAAPILILLAIQMFGGILVVDILAIALLSSESAAREFSDSNQPVPPGYPEYSNY